MQGLAFSAAGHAITGNTLSIGIGGATLHLNFSGADTLNALRFVGIARALGFDASSDGSFITGAGTLTISTGPARGAEGEGAAQGTPVRTGDIGAVPSP